jgi:hypothetical protein
MQSISLFRGSASSVFAASRSRRRLRAAVEALEARLVLSTFVVNTIADQIDPAGSKTVSLRDAVAQADAQTSGSVTISFDPTVFATAQTLSLSAGLELSNTAVPTSILGPAAGVTISGAGLTDDGGVTAGMSQLTFSDAKIYNNGNLTFSNGTLTKSPGGGINNGGTLVLQNSTVSNNDGNGTALGLGGGLYNSGTATIVECTFVGNSASTFEVPGIASAGTIRPDLGPDYTNGGAILNAGTLTLTDSTISGNNADNGGALYNRGTATVSDCTISGNYQNIANQTPGGTLTLANSIVADSTGGTVDVAGAIKSLGHNLIGVIDSTSSGYISSDLTGTSAHPLNPDLAPLANNGGPTQTQLPLAGSPAIGAGSVALIPAGVTADQRGFARTVGGKVDIGAVEIQALITGTVFNDANGDGAQDNGETGLAGVQVYADLENVGYFVTGDPTSMTNATGGYTLSGLAASNYIVRQVPPAGYAQTFPSGGLGHHVTVATGQTLSGQNFGDKATAAATATVTGTVYDDVNGNGIQDNHENGLPSVQVYDDLGNVGYYVAGDPSTMTNAGGVYTLSGLSAGPAIIRQIVPSGYAQTEPSGGLGRHLTLSSGQGLSGQDFGDKPVTPATITVNTILDQTDPAGSKTVSLIDAVNQANASSGPVTIAFDPKVFATAQTLQVLSDSTFVLDGKSGLITVAGPAAGVTISGGAFYVEQGASVSVSGFTITDNSNSGINNYGMLTVSDCTISGNDEGGSGIFNAGTMTLTDSMVSGNTTTQFGGGRGAVFGGLGAGIHNTGKMTVVDTTISGNGSYSGAYGFGGGGGIDNSGTLTLTDSTVSANKAVYGAGIENTGTLTLTNSTIANNDAFSGGGGIVNGTGGTATITDCTVSGNIGGAGGGIDNSKGGPVTLANTIVAANSGAAATPDVAGTVKSLGHNLVGKTNGSSGWVSSDLTGTSANPLDPELGTLASNGGPTQTQVPLAGSPAIGAGSVALIPAGITTDQRGLARVVGGKVDIGAVELQASGAIVAGTVFNDANGDGAQDNGETGLAGIQVYLDLGNVGYFVNGDPTTMAVAGGGYTLSGLAAGNYIVRQVAPSGYVQTTPSNGFGHHVTVSSGQTLSGQNFGDKA